MDLGDDFIDVVKTITKGFCKDTIKNMEKYFSVASYLVFITNPIVPGDTILVYIRYRYNYQKDIYLVETEGGYNITPVRYHLYYYPDHFIMFPFDLLFSHKLYTSALVLSMRYTPTKKIIKSGSTF